MKTTKRGISHSAKLARKLGYRSERELLIDLYERSRISIRLLASILKRSYSGARGRLQAQHIPLRERGGPNRRAEA